MRTHRVIVSASALAAAAAIACSGAAGNTSTTQLANKAASAGSGTPSPIPSSADPALTSGLGTFTVWMTDAPNPDVDQIWVKVSNVTIHFAGAGWVSLTNDANYPVSVDLLKLQDTAKTLGFLSLPPGTVTQIRLIISEDPGPAGEPANYVVLKNDPTETKIPLKVPSGYESGIKIKGTWEVAPCTDTAVTIDFDGHNSIWYHPTGQGDEWILRPVIRVKSTVTQPVTCPAPEPPTPPSTCTTNADCGSLVCSATTHQCIEPVADGSECTVGTECASGTCSSGTCAGSSQPPVAVGGACPTGTGCAAPSVCASGTCVMPPGEPCSGNSECISGTSCISGTCVLPVGATGCTVGTECATSTCTANICSPAPAGTSCQQNAECLSNVCDTVTAKCSISPVNGACLTNNDCSAWNVCNGSTCQPSPTSGAIGSSCSQSTQCAQDNCTGGTCQLGGTGAYCTAGTQCASGTCVITTVGGSDGTCQQGPAS